MWTNSERSDVANMVHAPQTLIKRISLKRADRALP
jgi:hypothetical protein